MCVIRLMIWQARRYWGLRQAQLNATIPLIPFAFRSGNGEGAVRFIAAIHHGISAGRPLRDCVSDVLGKPILVASPSRQSRDLCRPQGRT
jgi:hypothetical protein